MRHGASLTSSDNLPKKPRGPKSFLVAPYSSTIVGNMGLPEGFALRRHRTFRLKFQVNH